ncbi:hypothetical protein SI65_05563 [Aspergillus cristatus]|uniref:Beta-glucuronidase C-terminal domain-containing protein n=1 Tax=Aspergillus cristatus TaxID=573508 RepID=A0A1E3BEY5_ASPCR|nr:hypothetical protein SI65_05563 [Aspergillus cristatus]
MNIANLTREIGIHHYMQVNEPPQLPPATRLERVLMNHTNIVEALAPHIQRAKNLEYLDHPYILSEMNSIVKQGRNGESNVFGDALWLVDFSLWAAEHNIRRLNFHQGTSYRYASWQPILNKGIAPSTKPPYYGQIMVATALGRSENMHQQHPSLEHTDAAYALFDNTKLSKLVVLNMKAFNSTSGADSRSSREYKFKVPGDSKGAKVQRLIAPGSDVEKDVTFGGVSYDYELEKGNAVVVDDMEENVEIEDGVLSITLPDSSAVLLTLN